MEVGVGMGAFGWGILSAISLPLGALVGLLWRPNLRLNSAFMAFGAGALLFALTIELFGHVPHHVHDHGISALWATLGGALAGGLLFDLLNQMVNNRGAFLRRLSSAKKYVARLKIIRTKKLIEELSQIKVLHSLEPEHMIELIRRVRETTYEKGQSIFQQGDPADEMFFIVSGQVEIRLHGEGEKVKTLAILNEGDTFGELGILSGAPRSAEAVAASKVLVYRIMKSDFDEFLAKSPELQREIQNLAASRVDDLSVKSKDIVDNQWKARTLGLLEKMTFGVTNEEVQDEGEIRAKTAGGAALAIWLGILIDGIPESLVIGILAKSASGISLAFIAGVFLANLPEAMSSAVSMRSGGMKYKKIMMMWGSICIMTGIGALIGSLLFPSHPTGPTFYAMLTIEGLAAGAMLTMIAETMLPEAFEQGGSIIGFSTLAGFLAALIVKVS